MTDHQPDRRLSAEARSMTSQSRHEATGMPRFAETFAGTNDPRMAALTMLSTLILAVAAILVVVSISSEPGSVGHEGSGWERVPAAGSGSSGEADPTGSSDIPDPVAEVEPDGEGDLGTFDDPGGTVTTPPPAPAPAPPPVEPPPAVPVETPAGSDPSPDPEPNEPPAPEPPVEQPTEPESPPPPPEENEDDPGLIGEIVEIVSLVEVVEAPLDALGVG